MSEEKEVIELSVNELEQINLRLGIVNKKVADYKYLELDIQITRTEMAKHIEDLVVSKGNERGSSWRFVEGKKLVKSDIPAKIDNKLETSTKE